MLVYQFRQPRMASVNSLVRVWWLVWTQKLRPVELIMLLSPAHTSATARSAAARHYTQARRQKLKVRRSGNEPSRSFIFPQKASTRPSPKEFRLDGFRLAIGAQTWLVDVIFECHLMQR